MSDDKPTNGIGPQLGRIEAKIDANDQRCSRIEITLELVRSHAEATGLSLAACQSAAARREKRISTVERRLRAAEDTSVVQIASQRVRWRTLATLGAVAIALVSAVATLSGMQSCRGVPGHHWQGVPARADANIAARAKK